MFLAWLEKNKDDPFARTLTYSQFPNYFTFVREKRIWKHRERGFSVGRLGHSTPAQGELYYLRLLLTKVRGPKNYEDIRTVNQIVYPTFREACYALGLLDDDNEYIDAIKEAAPWASGNYLRKFFTSMLLSHSLSQPGIVWEKTKDIICEDLLYITHANQLFKGLQFSSTHKEAVGLLEIEKLLLRNDKCLNDYPSLPKPNEENLIDVSNQLILQELNYNKEKENNEAIRLQNIMTDEQKETSDYPTRKNVIKAKALNGTSAGEDILIHRVKSFNGLKILILDEHNKCIDSTINVVHREVFQNLLQH
ncbi:hypothetical protein K1719_021194 [Acacia pycnantha]|nr:hypothetical protein K1719_021194 [Acacia pycnantha]